MSRYEKLERKSTQHGGASGVTQGRAVLEDQRADGPIAQKKLAGSLDAASPRSGRTLAGHNSTGLPRQLKAGVESLSGMSMDHVHVHYNSSRPAQLNAHAYAQGSDIHLAPGQEKHLPHEAWHVVQQAQGRVRPTMQMKQGVSVNDEIGLESEADALGARAADLGGGQIARHATPPLQASATSGSVYPAVAQRFGDGTQEERQAGEEFESWLQEYSELSGLIRFRYQPQLAGYRGTAEERDIQEELLEAKRNLIVLRYQIIDAAPRIKMASLDPYYQPLYEQIVEGRAAEDDVQKVDNPRRVGQEIEFPSLTLQSKTVTKNGVLLAYTRDEELNLPVLKIETEGEDRGSLSVELIYGPLPVEEYTSDGYLAARTKLFKTLSSGIMLLNERIAKYNDLLEGRERRYALVVTTEASQCQSKGSGIRTNTQTNVAVPYSAVGETGNALMAEIFDGEASAATFAQSRQEANGILTGLEVPNAISLMTQVIYHDCMYGTKSLVKGKEQKKDKHGFHVMFKVSPEDAVFSILSDMETLILEEWFEKTEGKPLLQAIKNVLTRVKVLPSRLKLGVDAGRVSIERISVALRERLLQGKQALGKVESDEMPFSGTELDAPVRHTMPRPSNRIPVMQDGSGGSHIVIEQRSGSHAYNDQRQKLPSL